MRAESSWMRHALLALAGFIFASLPCPAATAAEPNQIFRAGAAVVDITPTNFPVIVNGMFEERTATNAHDPLRVRSLALDDGRERLVIAVVDSCMLPRDLIDAAKEIASKLTGLPTDRMLVSATHTHSAPSSMGCLGSRVDPRYALYLPAKIAAAIQQAVTNLAPARIGWAAVDDYEHTFCRRWIRRPDKLLTDPFGVLNVRANMHPGHLSPDALGPSGPVDPGLSVLSVQTPDGRPLALLANYSMHYYESPMLSADYYGVFADKIAKKLGVASGSGPFVAIMSQGTSGDQAWIDYSRPRNAIGLDAFAEGVATSAFAAYQKIKHQDWAPLAMREAKLTLRFRVANDERMKWSRELATKIGDRLPRTQPEIYALEQIHLFDRPQAELKLQALRIGDLGITAIPNEVYGLTGLKIKAQSPLATTFNIELANGSEGYIPPPEQHVLGGYTTWAARTAGLETNAEPQIVEGVLKLLEEVAGQPRRAVTEANGAYAQALLVAKPLAYWRLNEFTGPTAHDATGRNNDATYEDGVAFYLPGPESPAFSGDGVINRAPHLAGGRLKVNAPAGRVYSLSLWFWSGLSNEVRGVTGDLFSRAADGDLLSIAGTNGSPGKLSFGEATGRTVIQPKTWNHVAVVRAETNVAVYLNGDPRPEISVTNSLVATAVLPQWFIGGRSKGTANFEGKLDEVAIFDRALTTNEIVGWYKLAGLTNPPPASAGPQLDAPPKSPAESLAAIHVRDGFQVELIAAEPLVIDPVAFEFGADGKLWVVEMADYPLGADGKMKPGGRVRFLEDTDGDGKYDKSTLFLDGLNMPNGIIPWHKGVIITAAPEIFYAEDTDGDGKADVRKTLFKGFKEGNPQLRVNGLQWGLDGWLYCANGWSGGVIKSEKTGATLDISGRDFRIKPDEGLIELQAGQSEFGRNRDDWGDWFGCDNSWPLFHYVIDDQYARRNPHIAAPDPKRQLRAPANPKVYPRSQAQRRYHSFEQGGHFTSACSTIIYRDETLFPRGPEQHAFTCEPVHNLVQHSLMLEDGVSFTAQRAEADTEPEFLASEDLWFRPVFLRTGPDGALWIADMYRYMIEHPEWLPPFGKDDLKPFYRHGDDKGRLYRVSRKGETLRAIPRLAALDTAQLVASLDSANGWQRDTAQRLLTERKDVNAVEPLKKLSIEARQPATRMQALCTLELLGALASPELAAALRDEHPGVRRQAVRLTEAHTAGAPQLLDALTSLTEDPDAKVRLQLALSLGAWTNTAAGRSLGRLAIDHFQDRYLVAAVMSSALPHCTEIVNVAVAAGGDVETALGEPLLNLALALNQRDDLAWLLTPLLAPHEGKFSAGQMEQFARFNDRLAGRRSSATNLMTGVNDSLAIQLRHVGELFAFARAAATNAGAADPERAAAIGLLGREETKRAEDAFLLAGLLPATAPPEIQRAAVKSLGRIGDLALTGTLLHDWTNRTDAIRSAILDEFLAREPWTLDLLDKIEKGKFASADVDTPRRDRLLKHRNGQIKSRAEKVFAGSTNPDRQKAIEQFMPALSLKGEPANGAAVFARICAVCHLLDGVGREVGPNLRSVIEHPPEKLLTSILDPGRAVEPGYQAHTAVLHNGEEVYGLIAAETGNSIVMKLSDGAMRTVLRTEIATLRKSDRSLMPDGLETGLTSQDMADLIHYLKKPAR